MVVRGRAASPIRPGLFIREQLLMEGDLNPAEIHSRLRDLVREVNKRRQPSRRIKATTWASFYRYFKHLEYFFLVEPTGRTEPVVIAPEALLHISDRDVVPARRVFYQLTDAGRAEPPHEAFHNPIGLWREIGYPPTVVARPRRERVPPVPVPPPTVPPPERPPVAPPRRPPPVVERLKTEANSFLPEILRLAQTVRERQPDRPALEALTKRMGEHYDRVESAWERSRGRRREELRELRDRLMETEAYLTELDDALDALNWDEALWALDQLSYCCRWPPPGEAPPAPPPPRPTPPPAPPPEKPVAEKPPPKRPAVYQLPKRVTGPAVARLMAYVRALPEEKVEPELERIEGDFEDWVNAAEEAYAREEDKEEPNEERLALLEERLEALRDAATALEERDPYGVVLALEKYP